MKIRKFKNGNIDLKIEKGDKTPIGTENLKLSFKENLVNNLGFNFIKEDNECLIFQKLENEGIYKVDNKIISDFYKGYNVKLIYTKPENNKESKNNKENNKKDLDVKEIVKDKDFLSKKSKNFTKNDVPVINYLLKTAEYHKDVCAGLASVQIGYHVRALVYKENDRFKIMLNPVIKALSKSTYEAEEGCLSLEGTRKVKRHTSIQVMFQERPNKNYVTKIFTGYVAEIIQHEIDHLNGKLI